MTEKLHRSELPVRPMPAGFFGSFRGFEFCTKFKFQRVIKMISNGLVDDAEQFGRETAQLALAAAGIGTSPQQVEAAYARAERIIAMRLVSIRRSCSKPDAAKWLRRALKSYDRAMRGAA